MQKHILKRLGIFGFWLSVTLLIIYVKENPKDIGELLLSSIFAVFFLMVISSIFLLYESGELKREGNLQLYKTNRIMGFALISI